MAQKKASDLNNLENYKKVLDLLPVGVYHLDMKGNFIYANKKAEELSGLKFKDVKNKNFLKVGLIHKSTTSTAARLFAKNLLGKKTGPDELVLKQKKGKDKVVLIYTKVTTFDGKKIIIGIVQDITKTKNLQNHLTTELKKQKELTKLMVNRELKMIDLKKKIKKLETKLKK